ncbi:beta-ketoacyl-ACP synthase III [Pseudoramibacter porci]|uniref:Beta-ketoacyl-[acyl-carrier-protein] synthase III n=1 Tax=Pseudoramibacter porci TaxID=2606631 RepID=A0A7X2NEX4_9FIRM|nr:beta-ketoacyl-ACP synthase III [Pseudoramibacter porci]MSS19332.1 ketoacyl-ACP synthase III [Pseudoramibacter porci]
MNGIKIIGTGSAVPDHVVTNDDLAQIVDTSDAWISERTGIRTRHFIQEDETASDLAILSAKRALAASGVAPEQIGAVVVATITGDTTSPSTANRVAKALGVQPNTPSFDISAACSGFVYALKVAQGMIADETDRPYAVVVGVEALSRDLDFTDRTTCILFGDGAGAAVVKSEPGAPFDAVLGAESDPAIGVPGDINKTEFITMDGRKVFRFAVRIIPKVIKDYLAKTGESLDDYDQVIFHQANSRIIEHAVKKLKMPPSKAYQNLDRFGNTSGASIPLALDEMVKKNIIQPGSRILCVGFGAGLTWGAAGITYAG